MCGDPAHLQWLISLCHSCHHEIEFDAAGSKISDLADKDRRLNDLMLSLRSKPLKHWAKEVAYVPKHTANDTPPPSRVKSPPPQKVTTHDLLRRLESLAYDLSTLCREVQTVRTELAAVRQRLSQVEQYEPPVPHFA